MEVANIDLSELADQVVSRILSQLQEPKVTPRLLDVEQAAVYLSRSKDAVDKLIGRGVIPVTYLDSKRQIDRVVLDKLISEKTLYR